MKGELAKVSVVAMQRFVLGDTEVKAKARLEVSVGDAQHLICRGLCVAATKEKAPAPDEKKPRVKR